MPRKPFVAAFGLAIALFAGSSQSAAPETRRSAEPARQARVASQEDLLARAVFQALLGDFALQRGELALASDAWTDLAQRTRDPQVIARAVQVAGHARQHERALELTRLWIETAPDTPKARQAEVSLLIITGRLGELLPRLQALLAEDPEHAADNFMLLNNMLGRIGDRRAAQQLVDRLAASYDALPEAHFAMAQAASNANDPARALTETERALALRPDWEMAALARAQLQSRQSPEQAIASLEAFIERQPAARDARLALARLLIGEKRYAPARQHFAQLLKNFPDNPEVIYPVAMLALQQGDLATGRAQLEHLLSTEFPDKSTIHFFLGQLEQEEKHPLAALEHYRQVTSGEQQLPAVVRAAQILADQGRLPDARQLLQAGRGSLDGSQLTLAEAQLLRDAGRFNDAYIALASALGAQPDHLELLYEAALVAERLGKFELLEAHLQHLLRLKPDHAHALNALGYSWADRNIRLDEAHAMISQALAQTPDDPFIMDSLGWVLYRQGKLDDALQTLQGAYRIKADAEIAAHLAEVLWHKGRQDEARRLLEETARRHPDHSVVSRTLQKLQP